MTGQSHGHGHCRGWSPWSIHDCHEHLIPHSQTEVEENEGNHYPTCPWVNGLLWPTYHTCMVKIVQVALLCFWTPRYPLKATLTYLTYQRNLHQSKSKECVSLVSLFISVLDLMDPMVFHLVVKHLDSEKDLGLVLSRCETMKIIGTFE